MPLTITKLKMWKDPGYTRECVEVPPRGSWKLPAADYVSAENLRPRKGSTLTAVELPLPYLQVMDMSYLYIEVEDGMTPPNTVKVFGWIVSIEEIASSSEAVRITWTVDYWRTYAQDAVFGAGTVTRCADSTYKRPYQTQPRKWVFSKKEDLYPLGSNPETLPAWYVIVSYNDRTLDSQTQQYVTTKTNVAFWSCGLGAGEAITIGGTTYRAPSLPDVFLGGIKEMLGIPAEAINGIFISPLPPDTPSATVVNKDYIKHDYGNNEHSFAYLSHAPYQGMVDRHNLASTFISDDTHKTVIVDPTGAIMYTLPWGMSVSRVALGIDAGTAACALRLSLLSSNAEDNKGALLASEARMVSIPLINAPVNSNGYASYMFSGQREFDMNVREIQREEKMIAGISNVGMSAIGGAIAGKGVGAVAGGLMGAGSLALENFYAGVFNDRLQDETDKLYANQIPSLIQGAGGIAPFSDGTVSLVHWYIVQLEADSVSASEYSQHIANDGYTTEIPVTDASAFVTAGGPLQIQNLNLTGQIPPEAKTYIKNILSNGIRIVENNPTGVNP